jgi:transcriptional regulator with XRE-family HTH domain
LHKSKFKMSKSILEKFGENVRKKRVALKMSQQELGNVADLHRTYIGMIERAEKNITLLNIEKIAEALNVKIAQLLEDND